uniref:Glycosyltransferase 2-like domain-containing protein n=1 Tax=viral metagenome TaxID=1070528 RepID=A0A6C0HC30_9ZZZZ
METLLRNKDHIFRIKERVENLDPSLFEHYCIQNREIDDETISIVMTSSNRSKQTLFTLKTIADSVVRNIQVIIVDDSDSDPLDVETIKNNAYLFNLDIVKIKRENKDWHNPLVNYNIGFKFIKGSKVIIQNAEVCHIGDVLQFVNQGISDDNYYVFDVNASLNYETNETIYNSNTKNTDIYKLDLFWLWYQSVSNNRKYHFLTSMTTNTFNKIKEFNYDYTMGASYDDNDFVLKIISKNVNIINVFNNEHNIGGIHLYHGMSPEMWDKGVEDNVELFNKKKRIYDSIGIYVDATENIEEFDRKYENLRNA